MLELETKLVKLEACEEVPSSLASVYKSNMLFPCYIVVKLSTDSNVLKNRTRDKDQRCVRQLLILASFKV